MLTDPLSKLIESIVKARISESEHWFKQYLTDNKQQILAELQATGRCVIKCPYGLTATITAEKKEDSEKLPQVS